MTDASAGSRPKLLPIVVQAWVDASRGLVVSPTAADVMFADAVRGGAAAAARFERGPVRYTFRDFVYKGARIAMDRGLEQREAWAQAKRDAAPKFGVPDPVDVSRTAKDGPIPVVKPAQGPGAELFRGSPVRAARRVDSRPGRVLQPGPKTGRPVR